MASTQASSQGAAADMPLPSKFESILSLLDMGNDRLALQPFVSVIGLVKDFQPPVQTRGSDWKCSVTLVDRSTEFDFDYKPMKVNIFLPQDKMPRITGAADVLLVRNAKVQMYAGQIGLLSNKASEFHVFPAKDIPEWPLPSLRALPKSNSAKGQASVPEITYVVWLHNHIDRGAFPSGEEFESRCKAAMNHKDKYSLLQDLKADKFYDLIGEVIKVYENNGRVTMYLSDYTPHPLFYHHAWGGNTMTSDSRDDDEYSYVTSRPKATKDWPGPFGKMSLQLTLFDNHATFVRDQVKVSDWVILRNVHVKMGHQGGCIEGLLHHDRGAHDDKVQVQIIRRSENPELNDPRWKEGLRRKKHYLDEFEDQKREILKEPEIGTLKRNAPDESSRQNSKKRRKERRNAAVQKVAVLEEKAAESFDLNVHVKCNHSKIKTCTLSEILHDKGTIILSNGSVFGAPFTNTKYRANVRVVDFWPPCLKDFSVGRRSSEFDVLSDYSGGEDTDLELDMQLFRAGKGYGGPRSWEWRFALEVECVTSKAEPQPERLWLVVGNDSAQMLLDMDASNLRGDAESLDQVRETLFRLWGDLEEKKSAFLEKQERVRIALKTESEQALPTPAAVTTNRGGEMPPDSDEETPPNSKVLKSRSRSNVLAERHPNVSTSQHKELEEKFSSIKISNKPFTCCIQQYGVKVPEVSAVKADAGNGMRWQRSFGLFGTRIHFTKH